MDNLRVSSLIKSFLLAALIFIVFVGGYMVGYQIRGAHTIYMINNILLHESKNTTNDRTMLTCARAVLQDSVRNFYILPEYTYLDQFKECEGNLGNIIIEDKVEEEVDPVLEGIGEEEEVDKPVETNEDEKVNDTENTESVLPYAVSPEGGPNPYREIK